MVHDINILWGSDTRKTSILCLLDWSDCDKKNTSRLLEGLDHRLCLDLNHLTSLVYPEFVYFIYHHKLSPKSMVADITSCKIYLFFLSYTGLLNMILEVTLPLTPKIFFLCSIVGSIFYKTYWNFLPFQFNILSWFLFLCSCI